MPLNSYFCFQWACLTSHSPSISEKLFFQKIFAKQQPVSLHPYPLPQPRKYIPQTDCFNFNNRNGNEKKTISSCLWCKVCAFLPSYIGEELPSELKENKPFEVFSRYPCLQASECLNHCRAVNIIYSSKKISPATYSTLSSLEVIPCAWVKAFW